MSKVHFGLPDYWRMLRKYGPRLPISYFFGAHLFDLINKTDTHVWLPQQCYEQKPKNFDHGVLYMSSWTGEIARSFNTLQALVENFADYTFIDIGCGKGKVVLVWQKLLNKYQLKQKVYGVDYYEPLIRVAKSNHIALFLNSGNFICADATKVDYSSLGEKFIIYLYNPFDENILGELLCKFQKKDVFVIYNYPLHASTLLGNDFEIIRHRSGFHPNCQTKIFRRKTVHIASPFCDITIKSGLEHELGHAPLSTIVGNDPEKDGGSQVEEDSHLHDKPKSDLYYYFLMVLMFVLFAPLCYVFNMEGSGQHFIAAVSSLFSLLIFWLTV